MYGVGITTEELLEAVIGETGEEVGPVNKGIVPEPVGNGKPVLFPAGNDGVKLGETGEDEKGP